MDRDQGNHEPQRPHPDGRARARAALIAGRNHGH
jgi:hypothetical protein